MAKPSTLKTTTLNEVREQRNVKAFLDINNINSKSTSDTYLAGLAKLQEFLNVTTKEPN